MTSERKARGLSEFAEQAAPDTLDLWPGIRSRARARTARASAPRWRLASSVAVALVLALVAIGALTWRQPELVSAEAILARAQAASETTTSGRTYHLQTTSRSGVKPFVTSLREAWLDGTRARQTYRLLDSSGKPTTTIDVIFDGTQGWTVVTADGRTNVVHSSGADLKIRAEGMEQPDSLASFLALYNNAKSCMTARVQGEGIVAGRATYEIAVEPDAGACTGAEPANEPADGAKPPSSDNQPADQKAVEEKAQKALKQMRFSVDKETYLPLKTAVYAVSGEIIEESEATSVEYDVAIPDSTFSYTPPVGATVSEAGDKAGASLRR